MRNSFFVLYLFVCVAVFINDARCEDLMVSASMAPGTFVAVVSKVDSKGTTDSKDDTWTKQSGMDLSFGELKEITGTAPGVGTWSVMLPVDNAYFAVDCGISGGGYEPGKSISVSFIPGVNGDLLGERAIVSYVRTVLQSDGKTADEPLVPEKKLLKDARTVLFSEVVKPPDGGWLRLYIGINNGQSDVPGAKTFSSADPVGNYSGTLVVSML
jgi:hypothetical protein